jgi:hypothetical protein
MGKALMTILIITMNLIVPEMTRNMIMDMVKTNERPSPLGGAGTSKTNLTWIFPLSHEEDQGGVILSDTI